METSFDNNYISSWKGDISYRPAVVAKPESIADIVRVVKDSKTFPTPVRVKGSHHSVTKCIVAEGGTVLDMSRMNRILKIDRDALTITMEAGVLLKDASGILEKLGLQFYVNVEIGNLTVGSGACCGTKKASYFFEDGGFGSGQVSSYVESFKVVQADGSERVVDGRDAKLLHAMRSSYGMLGVVCEVTYKIKKLQPMAFEHLVFNLEEFEVAFPALVKENKSTMLYIFPSIDRIVVERRWTDSGQIGLLSPWLFRNFAWKTITPLAGKILAQFPVRSVRDALLDGWFHSLVFVLGNLRGSRTSPEDQIIRYPERGGLSAYTFSLWAFDEDNGRYVETLKDYFKFCKEYYEQQGYRSDMPSVGYRVAKEENILFSYTRNGFAVTVDPVSSGNAGWEKFLDAFNQRYSSRNGRPLFNQTPQLTADQVQRAFGPQIKEFLQLREQHDPDGRFYTDWFQTIFGDENAKALRKGKNIRAA